MSGQPPPPTSQQQQQQQYIPNLMYHQQQQQQRINTTTNNNNNLISTIHATTHYTYPPVAASIPPSSSSSTTTNLVADPTNNKRKRGSGPSNHNKLLIRSYPTILAPKVQQPTTISTTTTFPMTTTLVPICPVTAKLAPTALQQPPVASLPISCLSSYNNSVTKSMSLNNSQCQQQQVPKATTTTITATTTTTNAASRRLPPLPQVPVALTPLRHLQDLLVSTVAAVTTTTPINSQSLKQQQDNVGNDLLLHIKEQSKIIMKPLQIYIDSYDNDVVKAVRNNDVIALRLLHHGDTNLTPLVESTTPSSSSSSTDNNETKNDTTSTTTTNQQQTKNVSTSTGKKLPKDLNACNRFGESLLHMACRRGNYDVVHYLVHDAKVNIHCRDDYGRTPFHDACWTCTPNVAVLNLLIQAVILRDIAATAAVAANATTTSTSSSSTDTISTTTTTSDTTNHVYPMNPTAYEFLLLEDVRGHTPFHYSRQEHHPIWIEFLQQNTIVLQQCIVQSIQKLKVVRHHQQMQQQQQQTGPVPVPQQQQQQSLPILIIRGNGSGGVQVPSLPPSAIAALSAMGTTTSSIRKVDTDNKTTTDAMNPLNHVTKGFILG